ncbi:MAG: hypothetical protein JSU68_08570, partial [Phycisphaerales bacterium]
MTNSFLRCNRVRTALTTPRPSRLQTGRQQWFRPLHLTVLALLLLPRPALAEDWLQWGGPNGDFTVQTTGLADKWPADGPVQLWKRPLGDGYSSILCKSGRLFTAYRDG